MYGLAGQALARERGVTPEVDGTEQEGEQNAGQEAEPHAREQLRRPLCVGSRRRDRGLVDAGGFSSVKSGALFLRIVGHG